MKKILIPFCLISQATFAQTLESVTTNGAYTTKTVEFRNPIAFNIKGNPGNPAYGLLDQTTNGGGQLWRFGHTGAAPGFGSFDIFNESAQIIGLSIANTGNVGIGTGTPNSYYHGGNNKSLEIWNPNTVTNSQSHLILSTASLVTGSVGSISWMAPNAPGNKGVAFIGAHMPHDVTDWNASGELAFATADHGTPLVKMRLMANGNLGVGTQSPTHRLHVIGGGGIMATDGPLNAYTSQGVPDPNINDPATSLLGANGLMSNHGEFYYWRAFWGQSIDLRAGGIPDADKNIFRVRRFDSGSSWTELFRVNENGNVGIGTTHNGDYKLTVNGTLAARKVKVTQEAWADFVFEDHYKLPSLESIETHIKAFKHLPGIPSANEIAEKGMDLGDMQQKQMQKIEELTLYVIELNKKLAAQEEVISQLKKKLEFPKKQ